MVDNAIPSKDPANLESLGGTFKEILKKNLQTIDDMLPAKVIAYDRASNTATVQPMVKLMNTEGQSISRPQYASVPVFAIGGGYSGGLGFVINFPLQSGDVGWIKANDRDISLYVQAASETNPNTARLHTFKDGMFFPDAMRKFTIDGEDEDAMVIQLSDNSAKFAIHRNGNIKIKTNQLIDVEFDECNMTGNQINITADVDITGNITTTGTLQNNGKDVGSTHTHSGVTTGASNTGTPN